MPERGDPPRRLNFEDVVGLKEYDARRGDWMRRIVELKAPRRVPLGRALTLTFENFATVHFQLQETLRAGRLAEPEKVELELRLYNWLLPRPGELTASLFVERGAWAESGEAPPALAGIEKTLSLRCGAEVVSVSQAIEHFLDQEGADGRANSVFFARFPFAPEGRKLFLDGESAPWLVVDHPNLGAAARLPARVWSELKNDLSSSIENSG